MPVFTQSIFPALDAIAEVVPVVLFVLFVLIAALWSPQS